MRDPHPHILVVDNDASTREALGAALRRLLSQKTHPCGQCETFHHHPQRSRPPIVMS